MAPWLWWTILTMMAVAPVIKSTSKEEKADWLLNIFKGAFAGIIAYTLFSTQPY